MKFDRVRKLGEWIERDRKESDKVLAYAQELQRAVLNDIGYVVLVGKLVGEPPVWVDQFAFYHIYLDRKEAECIRDMLIGVGYTSGEISIKFVRIVDFNPAKVSNES